MNLIEFLIMRVLVVFFLFLSIFNSIKAQNELWQWVNIGGAAGTLHTPLLDERVVDLEVDQHGNIYGVCPVSSNGVVIDSFSPTWGNGWDDFVVFSYSCDGQFRWAKLFGTYTNDWPGGIEITNDGGVFVCGHVEVGDQYDAQFGDSIIPMTNTMLKHSFVAKLDSAGHTEWINFPGPLYNDTWAKFLQCEEDSQGDIHVLSWFNDTATWNGYSFPNPGYYIIKFSQQNGNINGVVDLDFHQITNGCLYGNLHFKIDEGNYYLTSQVYNTLYVGNDTVSVSSGYNSSVLAKFNSSGQKLWSQVVTGKWGDSSNEFYQLISGPPVIHGNNVYVSGTTQSFPGSNFLGFPVHNPIADFPNWRAKVFAKFNKNSGAIKSVLNLQSKGSIYEAGLAAYGDKLYASIGTGELVIMNQSDTVKPIATGWENYPCVVEMDTALTQFNWGVATNSIYPNARAIMTEVLVDDNNNIIICGGANGALTNSYGDTTHIAAGGEDFFIAKIALTNDSCGCVSSKPWLNVVSSTQTQLSVLGNTFPQADSLYIYWGDGDSTIYSTPGIMINHTYSSQGPWDVCIRAYSTCGIKDTCLYGLMLGDNNLNKQELACKVYPNPAQSYITVELNNLAVEPVLFELYNNIGQKVIHQQTHSPCRIINVNLDNQQKGIHFYRVFIGRDIFLGKLIID